MGIEIERKFLVEGESWKGVASEGLECRQGYLVSTKEKTVRVRRIGSQAFLTIKGASSGITRSEFEYEIPVQDAEAILKLCDHVVEKIRYLIEHDGMTWELDVFAGANAGLVMAEIELEAEDQLFVLPAWAGKEVSCDPRYYNAALSKHPFSQWSVD
jgi:adenylate cyclase